MVDLSYASKRYLTPFLAGATSFFYLPTAKRIIHENPNKLLNPNENDLQKFYWKKSPRSAITTTLGFFTGAYFIADKAVEGSLALLLKTTPHLTDKVTSADINETLILGGTLAATNFLSFCYEFPEMRNKIKRTQL